MKVRMIGVLVLSGFLFPVDGLAANLVIRPNGPSTELALLGQASFHSTRAALTDARLIEIPGSGLLLALWNEHVPGGPPVPHYAFSFDGQTFAFARETSYEILTQRSRNQTGEYAHAARRRCAAAFGMRAPAWHCSLKLTPTSLP